MKNYQPLKALLLALFFLLSACGGGPAQLNANSKNQTTSGELLKSSLLATKSASFLSPYSVDAYKIIYTTKDTQGKLIRASGLLSIPRKDVIEKSPLLSYQHGTIFLNRQAPSISSTSINAIMQLAGIGYIVSAPDYIGYGESANQMHPYIHAKSLASASIDMLRASKAFLKSKNIRFNQQLFLAGYSEGGYATLAMQKQLQEHFTSEFSITASAPGAGPFDLLETAKVLANQHNNPKPAYMNFLIKTYDSIYALNQINNIYQAPYVKAINSVFDGKHSAADINSRLSHITPDLFKPDFLAALQGNGKHPLKSRLALNSIYNWKPLAPTRLYHGPRDEVVPYINAQRTLDVMQNKGAEHVSLSDCPLNTHVQCAVPYIIDTIGFFSRYANDL